ncbi:MAG: ribbon-helix-helix protein, CopG family [Candidatus Heimdallarchaeota archaeon]
MTIVQVRVDDEESKELDALAKKLGISKSELIRKIIKRGKKGLLFDFHFERLIKNEISLTRAAAEAGLSVVEFVTLAKERGFTYFSYDSSELQRDIQTLEGKLEG